MTKCPCGCGNEYGAKQWVAFVVLGVIVAYAVVVYGAWLIGRAVQ